MFGVVAMGIVTNGVNIARAVDVDQWRYRQL